MSEFEYKCKINLYMECENQDAVDKLRELFVVKSRQRIIQMLPIRENTAIYFPIFHDLTTHASLEGQYSCCVEGHIMTDPIIDDFYGIILGITHGNSGIINCTLDYVCTEDAGYGTWKASRVGVSGDYIAHKNWPMEVCCDHCDRFDSMGTDSDSYYRPCDECEKMLKAVFDEKHEHWECWNRVCENFAITNKTETKEEKSNMDNLDRPKLEVSKEQMKQIYDAIENISCINDDMISKLGKASEMLKQIVHLANCLMAIWHGEKDNELSDIDEVSDSIDVINRATCDLADAMRNIGAELIND